MSAYAIFIRERTRDASHLEAYSRAAGKTLEGHPVKVLAAYGRYEVLEGYDIQGAVILEFPTVEAAKAWYESPYSREAREHRFKGADYHAIIVEGR